MSQSDLNRYTDSEAAHDYTPLRLLREIGGTDADRELAQWGMDADWLGKQPDQTPFDTFHRYQYNRTYYFPVDPAYASGGRQGRDQVYFPVEFRTYVDYAGQVPRELERHISQTDNPRCRELFDTGPYQDWMTNFAFEYHDDFVQREQIAADQASNLGIPQFEVEVKKNGSTEGMASGFMDPFKLVKRVQYRERPPEQEVWNLTGFNDGKGSYQIAPPGYTKARKRADNIRGKTVYINGAKVGTVTKGGRVWLKDEYANENQIYRGDHSREWLVENTDATYSALRKGGNLYKTRETGNGVYLVTSRAKPEGFDPADPDEIEEDAGVVVGEEYELALAGDDDPTTFTVRKDRGQLLGKYSTPTVREITGEPDWDTRYAPW